jgi:four helix bundle protein
MPVQDYKDLIVWQKSMDLVEIIYRITESFPSHELYGLTKQIRRAAVSVPSNIAEGQGRQGTAEFRHFLSTARGSLLEVETQLHIGLRLKYLDSETAQTALVALKEVARILNGLMSSLSRSSAGR